MLLIVPGAAAVESSGDFDLAGPLDTGGGSSKLSFDPLAILSDDTSSLDGLALSAPEVHVRVFEWRSVAVGPFFATVETRETAFALTGVRLELAAGNQSGIFGVYPRADARADLTPSAEARVEPRQYSLVSSTDIADYDGPAAPWYHQHIVGPHLHVRAPGSVAYAGPGAVKLFGPDVSVHSAENTTHFETGGTRISATEVFERLVHLEFREGTIRIDTGDAPVEIAASGAPAVTWDGEARLTPTSGSLRTNGWEYVPPGGRVHLDGAFTARLTPTGAGTATLTDISGDLRFTSLVAQATAPVGPLASTGVAWITVFGAVAAGSVAVGGGAWAWRSRWGRGATFPPSAPLASPRAPTVSGHRLDDDSENALAYHLHYADLASGEERPGLALAWLRVAREHAPRDPELAIWEALLLRGLGDYPGAARCLEEAADLSPDDDGLADYYLGAVYAEAGPHHHPDLALVHLERALGRQPALAGAVMRDPQLAVLRGPEFEAMLEEALARLANGVAAWNEDDCTTQLHQAIAEERWEDALERARRARGRAPEDADLASAEALVLVELGRVDEALAAYADASRLTPEDGNVDLVAADLAAHRHRDPEEVEAWILRALEKDPSLWGEVEASRTLRPLLTRPRVSYAVHQGSERDLREHGDSNY